MSDQIFDEGFVKPSKHNTESIHIMNFEWQVFLLHSCYNVIFSISFIFTVSFIIIIITFFILTCLVIIISSNDLFLHVRHWFFFTSHYQTSCWYFSSSSSCLRSKVSPEELQKKKNIFFQVFSSCVNDILSLDLFDNV